MVVKESCFAELIPEADVIIFDEAHQLPGYPPASISASRSQAASCWISPKISSSRIAPEVKDTQQLQKCG